MTGRYMINADTDPYFQVTVETLQDKVDVSLLKTLRVTPILKA